jgi:hypothetical protein
MDGILREKIELTELEAKTRAEVEQYAAFSFTSDAYTLFDDERKLYAAVSVPHLPRPWPSRVIVMAQVVGGNVIIIEDITDKPLVDALMHNAGIPREHIVLAYQGETVPEEAK